MTEELTKEVFCALFVAHMVGQFPGDAEVAKYANDVAPTYFEDPDLREEGPEECADSDISYWEE